MHANVRRVVNRNCNVARSVFRFSRKRRSVSVGSGRVEKINWRKNEPETEHFSVDFSADPSSTSAKRSAFRRVRCACVGIMWHDRIVLVRFPQEFEYVRSVALEVGSFRAYQTWNILRTGEDGRVNVFSLLFSYLSSYKIQCCMVSSGIPAVPASVAPHGTGRHTLSHGYVRRAYIICSKQQQTTLVHI